MVFYGDSNLLLAYQINMTINDVENASRFLFHSEDWLSVKVLERRIPLYIINLTLLALINVQDSM